MEKKKNIFKSPLLFATGLFLGGLSVLGVQQHATLRQLENGTLAFTNRTVYAFKVDAQLPQEPQYQTIDDIIHTSTQGR